MAEIASNYAIVSAYGKTLSINYLLIFKNENLRHLDKSNILP